MPTTKALAITERAENQPVTIIDIPIPHCEADEVLIRNRYVGVNKGDAIRRKRALFPVDAQPPFILGFEGSGEIIGIGKDVVGLSLGNQVGYLVPKGAFAQIIAVKASLVFLKPQTASLETLAASCCIGLTAIGLLAMVDDPKSKTMLVHGCTGSVGSTLLQVGKAQGLRMIGTVSTAADLTTVAVPSGGLYSLDRGDFADSILAQTAGKGVDIIFDCLGQTVLDTNMKIIRSHGTIFYYGSASGHAAFPGADILMKSLRVQGFVVFDCASDTTLWQRMLATFSDYLERKVIVPHVNVLPPTELTKAMEAIDSRQMRGRAVVDMRFAGDL